MYARLWWKEARQFWPIWAVLLLAAAGTQWLVLSFLAVAFAGERETGTLRLLDVFPADRRVVWAGKFSFALVTTVILTVVLLSMAAVSTERWNPQNSFTIVDGFLFCMFVLVALGWGLFWSSILKTALAAALSAITCTLLTLAYCGEDFYFLSRSASIAESGGYAEMAVIIATVVASDLFFTGSERLKRLNFQLRSPVVFAESRSPRVRRIQTQLPVAAAPAPAPRPMAAMLQPQASRAARIERRSWLVETWVLVRQTIKEGIKTWLMLAAISMGLPAFLSLGNRSYGYVDPVWLVVVSLVVVLAAGASAFGLENRARTYRFLVHHGARPGSVWLVKVMTWILGIAVIAVSWVCFATFLAVSKQGDAGAALIALLDCLSLAFAVAVVCGMALRRGITAFVIALVLTLALAAPLLSMVYMSMLPARGILVVSAALLLVSWLWRGDWMLERPAPARWLRLGLFVTGAFALLSVCFVGFRVWSVPDVGPIAPPSAWADDSARALASPERNAAPLYTEASRRLNHYFQNPREFLSRNKVAVDLIRRAAAQPECRFDRPEKPTLVDWFEVPPIHAFAQLVNQEAIDRLERGDLAGTWDDIMVLFRMSRHFTLGSGVGRARLVLVVVERDALALALDWAAAPGQTPERLRAALEAYRNLPKMPPPGDVVRAEANIVENTLNLPSSKLRPYLEELMFGPPRPGRPDESRQVAAIMLINLVTTPWELAHAWRVNRLVSTEALESASREPGHRLERYSRDWRNPAIEYSPKRLPDPLSRLSEPADGYLFPDEQNEVARRALVQILAIRCWQLKHDGRFPETLDVLVPDELPRLPNDPYSDRPFAYVPWTGGGVVPLGMALGGVATPRESLQEPKSGSRLLYSVGSDRRDDRGIAYATTAPGRDLVFAIPPLEKESDAGKNKAESTPKAETKPTKPK
jgi:hypothetical protein